MLYREPTYLHLITKFTGSSLTSNYFLKFSVDTNFLFCLLNLFPKTNVQFQNLAASSVQKLILFSIQKTKRYLYLINEKAQGIIFHGAKTKQCMTQISMKEVQENNIWRHKKMHDSHFYENKTKHEATVFKTDAHR